MSVPRQPLPKEVCRLFAPTWTRLGLAKIALANTLAGRAPLEPDEIALLTEALRGAPPKLSEDVKAMLLQSEEPPILADEDPEENPEFESHEYRDPPLAPHRPEHWYNGSRMTDGYYPAGDLFGPKGRLRTLHTKITSRETRGSQFRESHYRHVSNLLVGFFPMPVLDALVEELLTLPNLRLPRAWEQAVSIVLAAMELYLRKTQRRTLREQVVRKIARALDLSLSMRKLGAAKLFLLKAGFMKDAQYEIVTSTYDVLRTLVVDVAMETTFPAAVESEGFRRQLYQECMRLIGQLEACQRRPQRIEVYAHVIVSYATERLCGIKFLTSTQLEDPDFQQRVYRAKSQFRRMLQPLRPPAKPVVLRPVAIAYTEFATRIRTATATSLSPAIIHVAWGEGLRFEVVGELFEAQWDEARQFPLTSFWITFILSQIMHYRRSLGKGPSPWPSPPMNSVIHCFTDDAGPGPPTAQRGWA